MATEGRPIGSADAQKLRCGEVRIADVSISRCHATIRFHIADEHWTTLQSLLDDPLGETNYQHHESHFGGTK